MQVLDFSSNHLVGKIPKELGQLKLLFDLKLNNNSPPSEVPAEIAMLSELRVLDLSVNKLSGPIPKDFEKLFKANGLELDKELIQFDLSLTDWELAFSLIS